MGNGVSVLENITTITVEDSGITVEARGLAIGATAASGLPFTPHGAVTATNVQVALEQLADQNFRTTNTPSGSNISEGDQWYDLDDNILKVYREVSSGNFAWTNVVVTEVDGTLDGGTY